MIQPITTARKLKINHVDGEVSITDFVQHGNIFKAIRPGRVYLVRRHKQLMRVTIEEVKA